QTERDGRGDPRAHPARELPQASVDVHAWQSTARRAAPRARGRGAIARSARGGYSRPERVPRVDRPIIARLAVHQIPAMQQLRREALTSDPLAFGATVEDDLALDTAYVERSLADPSTNAIFAAFVAHTAVGMTSVVRMTREKVKHRALVWGMFVQPAY